MPYLTDEQVADVQKEGGTEATYRGARDRERQAQKDAREEYPATYTAGEIGGALALPIGAGARGGTMAARAGRSALVGAGSGALAGVGSGETPDERITGGIVGGAIGAAGVPLHQWLKALFKVDELFGRASLTKHEEYFNRKKKRNGRSRLVSNGTLRPIQRRELE